MYTTILFNISSARPKSAESDDVPSPCHQTSNKPENQGERFVSCQGKDNGRRDEDTSPDLFVQYQRPCPLLASRPLQPVHGALHCGPVSQVLRLGNPRNSCRRDLLSIVVVGRPRGMLHIATGADDIWIFCKIMGVLVASRHGDLVVESCSDGVTEGTNPCQ